MKIRALKRGIYTVLSSLAIVFLVYYFCPKPPLMPLTSYSKAFFDADNQLLRLTLAEDDRYRLSQRMDSLPQDVIRATLLYEDQYFFYHPGVDFVALFRAFWSTYIRQERRVGASTITMQVARLRFGINSSTLSGKMQQIVRALQLNRHYSKQEILEAYFNLASYGRNIEGIAAASLIYFDKMPEDLNWPEATALSVIPQNPNKRDLSSADGYREVSAARRRLYAQWREQYPHAGDKAIYLDMPLAVRSLDALPFNAPHFIDFQLAQLSRWETGRIHTTLKLSSQKILEHGIRTYLERRQRDNINNASALLVNYKTREIEAMVGSANFFDKNISGQVNGTLAKRSPGSTLKPFVYGLAMDDGLIHPMTMLPDAPRRFGGFSPENFDHRFLGPVFAKDALIQSRNVPAVELQSRLQTKSFYQFLKQADVGQLEEESHYGLALALGGGEVSMLELTQLYAMLANGGEYQKLKSRLGENVDVRRRLLSAEASYLTLDILRDNLGPDQNAYLADSERRNNVAWKTGTSWAYRDAWAVGISGPYVLAVWIGNFDGKSNPAFLGRAAAGPLLFSLFSSLNKESGWRIENIYDVSALNIKRVEVCAASGDLPNKLCPKTHSTWFIPGVSPIRVSTVHRAIPVDHETGLRTCADMSGESVLKVFEFWPSDISHIFRQAGISLKSPPPYSPECDIADKETRGQNPVVTSPSPFLEYAVHSQSAQDNIIPFVATVDSDVNQLYWFVDGQYAGVSKRGEAYGWLAQRGDFIITAVDDSGRAGSTKMKVRFAH